MLSNYEVIMPLKLRRFLCEWYAVLYEKDQEDILGFMDLEINQYARMQIGAKIFGSMMSGQHEKSLTILAKWRAAMMNQLIYIQVRFNITLNIRLGFLRGQENIFWY